MKLRFWQKTYLLTLLLFLLCLYAGLFSLAFYTYRKNVNETERLCAAEQSYIAKSFERDAAEMLEAGGAASPSLLMESYGSHYGKEGIFLSFTQNGETVYSSFPANLAFPRENTAAQVRGQGSRYVVLGAPVSDGAYQMGYAKDVSSLENDFRTLVITYAAVAAVVSLLLAVGLLLVLKKLSLPLENLQKTTEKIAAGDRSVTADEAGNDEFSALAKSFNHMVHTVNRQMDELSEDARRKQMLVDNMAHELRTPLTSIRGYAEYIEKAAVPEEEKTDAAQRILSETDRLRKISEKILDTAFLRHHSIDKQPVDLSRLLADTAQRLEEKGKQRGVTVTAEGESCIVQGDETLLSMLFYNLTENAIKACGDGGKVTLTCSGSSAAVRDTGKGMTPEQLAHITEPFYRTDKSRSRAEGGAGLGLALCRQIAASHGAELTFRSEPGKGTEALCNFSSPQ